MQRFELKQLTEQDGGDGKRVGSVGLGQVALLGVVCGQCGFGTGGSSGRSVWAVWVWDRWLFWAHWSSMAD